MIGGPDKRPHIAPRSVDCFGLYFSPIRQCAASERNVRGAVNPLPKNHFSHIFSVGTTPAVGTAATRDRFSTSHAERRAISYM